MEVRVFAEGRLAWNGRSVRCALGRGGIVSDKREGDGATPTGIFPLRRVLYRADRLPQPATALPVAPLRPDDGWCDDPGDGRYNRPVRLPCTARHERLWREDGLYDVVAIIGYNDTPVVSGRGSAIFLHCARADYAPTEGCVALALPDLLAVLAAFDPGDRLAIGGVGA